MSSTGDDEPSETEMQPPPGNFSSSQTRPPPSAQVAPQDLASSPSALRDTGGDEAYDSSDDDAESDYSDRENRFEGPASTWRKYTQDERQLIASLDQQRANDLSIHLYNAHALKRRLYDTETAAEAKPWHNKQRWMKRDESGNLPWHPDRNWTAWPLPPDEVPRRDEQFGAIPSLVDDDAYNQAEDWLPSADLQEEVQALMLRKAKERFRRRRWAADESNADPQEAVQGSGEQADIDEGAERSSNGSGSPLRDLERATEDQKPTFLPREKHVQPAFLADDDQAYAILQPTVRHILSKFDDLLVGLHKSRQGHRLQASTSRSRSRPAASRSRSRSRVAPKSTRTQRRLKGKQRATASDEEDPESDAGQQAAESEEESNSPAPSQQKRRASGASRHDLGLRDWSEVLGMAALTGWDRAVIDRAARRCASLFCEGVTLRTMPETAAPQTRDRVVQYVPDMVPLESESEDEGVAAEHAWYCPFEDCSRHNEAYERCWRWREHLRRTHKLSLKQVEQVETSLGKDRGLRSNAAAAPSTAEREATVGSEEAEQASEDEVIVGGVHEDGFLQPVPEITGRGRDVKPRRRRSANDRKDSKKRKLDREAQVEDDE